MLGHNYSPTAMSTMAPTREPSFVHNTATWRVEGLFSLSLPLLSHTLTRWNISLVQSEWCYKGCTECAIVWHVSVQTKNNVQSWRLDSTHRLFKSFYQHMTLFVATKDRELYGRAKWCIWCTTLGKQQHAGDLNKYIFKINMCVLICMFIFT